MRVGFPIFGLSHPARANTVEMEPRHHGLQQNIVHATAAAQRSPLSEEQ